MEALPTSLSPFTPQRGRQGPAQHQMLWVQFSCAVLTAAVMCPHLWVTDGEAVAPGGHTTPSQGYSANKLGLEPNPFDSEGLVLATE